MLEQQVDSKNSIRLHSAKTFDSLHAQPPGSVQDTQGRISATLERSIFAAARHQSGKI
jgi:hypothetical protein